MFFPIIWLYRHGRRLRLALFLCIIASYCTLIFVSAPLLVYFDQLRGSENPASKFEDSTGYGPSESGYKAIGVESRHAPETVKDSILVRVSSEVDAELVFKPRGDSISPTGNASGVDRGLSGSNATKTDVLAGVVAASSPDSGSPDPRTSNTSEGGRPPLFGTWKSKRLEVCGGKLDLYAKEFARLQNVIVDRRLCLARAKGGEEIESVLQQTEEAEYYTSIKGCFQLDCNRDIPRVYSFNGDNFLSNWLRSLKTSDVREEANTTRTTDFTIAFMRREYANLYHTVNDWYTIYLLMNFFRKSPEETNIVLVDAHPKGKLDEAWPVLFNSTRLLSATPVRTSYADMVWGMQGYNSPLKDSFYGFREPPPLLEEFRQFFLDRFKINGSRPLDCKRLSVLFIWRHDYLAHPRNPTGLVQRKIANEEELLDGLRHQHPDFHFRGIQIDKFSVRNQLQMVTDSDIVVGMHGAGLSHTLFVPPHGAMIELVPYYYGSENEHFINLARWRGLYGQRWVNLDRKLEMKNYYTKIPVDTMSKLLKTAATQICTETREQRLASRAKAKAKHLEWGYNRKAEVRALVENRGLFPSGGGGAARRRAERHVARRNDFKRRPL